MVKEHYLDVLEVSYKIGLYKNEKTLFQALKKLYKKHKMKDEDGIIPAGFVFNGNGHFYIMFSIDHLDTQLVAHEVHHLTQQIAISLGLSRHGDKEFMAILNGYINKKVTQYIKKKGIQLG